MSQKMLNGRAVKIYLPNQDRYGMGKTGNLLFYNKAKHT